MKTIINAYLRQFVRNREVYFGLIPHMSPELEKLLGKVETDIKEKRNISSAFSTKRELKNYLASL